MMQPRRVKDAWSSATLTGRQADLNGRRADLKVGPYINDEA